MRKKILSAFLFVAIMACAQTAEFFKPYASTDLRLPSVPLVVNDPYFSIWSPYDKLTDGTTLCWVFCALMALPIVLWVPSRTTCSLP